MISSTVTVTALVFAVFIKCPMFSNEQCDKAPYGPVGAARQPHSHAYHSPNLFDDGFTVSLVQCIFIPNKTDSHRRHQRTIPGARLTFHALGGAKVQTTSGAQDDSTPKLDMDRRNMKKHLSEQMCENHPTLAASKWHAPVLAGALEPHVVAVGTCQPGFGCLTSGAE